MFDPHWSLSPFLIGLFYYAHSQSQPNEMRFQLAITLGTMYGLRLTYNYFRVNGWEFYQKADWRYDNCPVIIHMENSDMKSFARRLMQWV